MQPYGTIGAVCFQIIYIFGDYYPDVTGMKINKVQLSEKDKRKAYITAVRKASRESGIDKVTRPRVYKNKKKYSRKDKHQIIRQED